MSFSIDPNAHYALFKTDEFGDSLTHLILDLRVSREIDRVISHIEATQLVGLPNASITEFHVTLPTSVGNALEDMGLVSALDDFQDEDDSESEEHPYGRPYPGVDLFTNRGLVNVVEDESDDVLILKGEQIIELLGENPSIPEGDDDSARFGIDIRPGVGDFWVHPTFEVSDVELDIKLKAVPRIPWSKLRRRFIELSD